MAFRGRMDQCTKNVIFTLKVDDTGDGRCTLPFRRTRHSVSALSGLHALLSELYTDNCVCVCVLCLSNPMDVPCRKSN